MAKTISYRLLSTLIGFIIMWLITGSIKVGAAFSIAELIYKPVQYYLHERIWYRWVTYGLEKDQFLSHYHIFINKTLDMKILLIVIVIAAICTFFLLKKGKIKDQNNNNIPDFIEDAVEEVKEVAKEVKEAAKEVVEVVKPQPKKKVEPKKEVEPKKKVVKKQK